MAVLYTCLRIMQIRRNNSPPTSRIRALRRRRRRALEKHVRHRLRVRAVEVQRRGRQNLDRVLLAVAVAVAVVVVEERPHTPAVQEQVRRVLDVLEERHPALAVVGGAVGEIRVAGDEVVGPGGRREVVARSLPVRRLALLERREDVLRGVEVVLV